MTVLSPAPKPELRVKGPRPVKPRTPLPRATTPIMSKGRSRFPKRRDEAFRAWVARHPCSLAGRPLYLCSALIDAAHLKTRGAGGYDVGNLVPLCRHHHTMQHEMGIKSFLIEAKGRGADLVAIAEALASRWAADHLEIDRHLSKGPDA